MSATRLSLVPMLLTLLWCAPAAAQEPAPRNAEALDRNMRLRGKLTNSRRMIVDKKQAHVAFIGGSITEMNGYRPMMMEFFKQTFPDCKYTFTDAGIASTCSTTGAMRLADDVLSKGPVDLFFVEFAVNDDQDAAHARRECIRGMEGIIRQTRKHNPNADIVLVHFVNPGMIELLKAGKTPVSIEAHEAVAEHYQIPSVNLAREVTEEIDEGKLTWKQYGGVHPAEFGNRLCENMVTRLVVRGWTSGLFTPPEPRPHKLPAEPLDAGHYGNGRFVDPAQAKFSDGWQLHTPDWKSLPGNCRERFAQQKLLCGETAGAELTLEFEGRAVGAYLLAGPDAGTVEASVDGGDFQPVDLYHRFSKGLHYPRTVMFAADLEPGKHTLKLRVAEAKNEASSGHAVRVLKFVAN